MIILGYFFLFLHKTIYCGYPLETTQRGSSNEYPQNMFLRRNRENYPNIIKVLRPDKILKSEIKNLVKSVYFTVMR